jgi:hypothetical protein
MTRGHANTEPGDHFLIKFTDFRTETAWAAKILLFLAFSPSGDGVQPACDDIVVSIKKWRAVPRKMMLETDICSLNNELNFEIIDNMLSERV